MARWFPILMMLVLGVFLVVDAHHFAKSLAPSPLNQQIPPAQVDLIVALTGGKGRILEAVNFLEHDKGRYLFISGTTPGTTLKSIFAANRITTPVDSLKDRIFLDERARNTVGNAVEVRSIAEKLSVKSLLLVTSSYHIQRARELLERSLSRAPEMHVEIYEYAVYSSNFDSDNWYRSVTGWQILVSEYLKSRFGL